MHQYYQVNGRGKTELSEHRTSKIMTSDNFEKPWKTAYDNRGYAKTEWLV